MRSVLRLQRAAALGACALAGVLAGCGGGTEKPRQRVLTVRTLELALADKLDMARPFTAMVEARRASMAGFELTGTLVALHVDEGDSVEAGEVLARLDTRRLLARRAEVNAALDEARASRRLAEATLERQEAAVKRQAVSVQVLDETRRERDAAAAAVRRLRAQLEGVEVDLDKSVLRAPYAGRIARRFIDEGSVVQPGMPVYELLESGEKEARLGVDPGLAATLSEEQALDAVQGDTPYRARVLRALPRREQRTRTVSFRLLVEDPQDELRTGDLLTVTLTETLRTPHFAVPAPALVEGIRGLWAVYVLGENEAGETVVEQRPVELIHHTGGRAYVRGTLQPGEFLISEGTHRITPGQRVEPQR